MSAEERPPKRIVLHVNHNNCVGGSALQMLRLARHQCLAGWRPIILTRRTPEWEAQRDRGGVEILFAPLRGSADVKSSQVIAGLVRERGVSVVHAHRGLDLALALLASAMVPVPAIVVHRTVAFPALYRFKVKERPERWLATRLWLYSRRPPAAAYGRLRGAGWPGRKKGG